MSRLAVPNRWEAPSTVTFCCCEGRWHGRCHQPIQEAVPVTCKTNAMNPLQRAAASRSHSQPASQPGSQGHSQSHVKPFSKLGLTLQRILRKQLIIQRTSPTHYPRQPAVVQTGCVGLVHHEAAAAKTRATALLGGIVDEC